MAKRNKGRLASPTRSSEQAGAPPQPQSAFDAVDDAIPASEPAADASEAVSAIVDYPAQAPDIPGSDVRAPDAEPLETEAAAPPSEAPQDESEPLADESDASPTDSIPAPSSRATALDEVSALNGAVLSYLRRERGAAFDHWRALSLARSPADIIRLQIEEMQRAADASLTCLGMIARRSGRVAAALKAA